MLVIEDAFGVSSVKLDLDGNGVFETVLVEGVGFDLYPLNSEPKSADQAASQWSNIQVFQEPPVCRGDKFLGVADHT